MLSAVDTNEHKLILHAWSWHFVTIDKHANLARKEVLYGKRQRKIAKCQIVVKFHQQLRIRLREEVLPRNFASVNGVERNCRFAPRCSHELGSAADVPLANQQVKVAVSARGQI